MKKIVLIVFSLIVFVVAFVHLTLRWAESGLRKTEPYKLAYTFAMNDSTLNSRVGEIISIGDDVRGELQESKAYINFEIIGNERRLRVYFVFDRKLDNWVIHHYYTKE